MNMVATAVLGLTRTKAARVFFGAGMAVFGAACVSSAAWTGQLPLAVLSIWVRRLQIMPFADHLHEASDGSQAWLNMVDPDSRVALSVVLSSAFVVAICLSAADSRTGTVGRGAAWMWVVTAVVLQAAPSLGFSAVYWAVTFAASAAVAARAKDGFWGRAGEMAKGLVAGILFPLILALAAFEALVGGSRVDL